MKIIKWSSEKLGSHEILLDDEDFEKFGGYNWTVEKATTGGLYAKRKYTYALNKRKAIALHRVILGITDVSIFVDHITYTQNKQNIKIQKNNKSGFKGVLIRNETRGVLYKRPSYIVCLTQRVAKNVRKQLCRGTFYNPYEAAVYYNEQAIKHYDGTMYTHEVKTGHIVEQIRTFIRK